MWDFILVLGIYKYINYMYMTMQTSEISLLLLSSWISESNSVLLCVLFASSVSSSCFTKQTE